MFKRVIIVVILFFAITLAEAQFAPAAELEKIESRSPYSLTGYSAEDYSGITYIDGTRYAVVTDKKDGFYIFNISVSSTGSIASVSRGEYYGDGSWKNSEGIVYHPERNTVFIAIEGLNSLLEYNMNGSQTGNWLTIPNTLRNVDDGNQTFESLAYHQNTGLFWTTTESTLTIDGSHASNTNKIANLLRLQSFDESLQPKAQYAYKTDLPECTLSAVSVYAIGVAEMTALPDGRLLVLEREFAGGKFSVDLMDSFVKIKIYLVDPRHGTDISHVQDLRTIAANLFLQKTKLFELKTTLGASNLANYEGMCLGPKLGTGKYALLLINDAQSDDAFGVKGLLKEYILPLVISGIGDAYNAIPEISAAPLSAYPNPFGDVLYVAVPDGNQPIVSLTVTDLNGRILRQIHNPVPGTVTLDTGSWERGFYLLRTVAADGTALVQKVVKN